MQPRAGWVPAGSWSPSRVGLLRPSVASSPHAGTADWTHWSQPTLRANTTGAKKLKLCRREGLGSRYPIPHAPEPGAPLHTPRRGRAPTPRAHTRSGAHTAGRTPARALPLRRASGVGRSQTSEFCPQQAPLCSLGPQRHCYFRRSKFSWSGCFSLFSKLSPVTKSNLKHWRNQ